MALKFRTILETNILECSVSAAVLITFPMGLLSPQAPRSSEASPCFPLSLCPLFPSSLTNICPFLSVPPRG